VNSKHSFSGKMGSPVPRRNPRTRSRPLQKKTVDKHRNDRRLLHWLLIVAWTATPEWPWSIILAGCTAADAVMLLRDQMKGEIKCP